MKKTAKPVYYRHVCHRFLYFTIFEAKKDEASSTQELLRLYASADHVSANVEPLYSTETTKR